MECGDSISAKHFTGSYCKHSWAAMLAQLHPHFLLSLTLPGWSSLFPLFLPHHPPHIAAPHNRNLTPISLNGFQFSPCFFFVYCFFFCPVLNLPTLCKSSLHSCPFSLTSHSCLHIPPPNHCLIIVRFQPCPSHRASIVSIAPLGFPSIKPDMQHDR